MTQKLENVTVCLMKNLLDDEIDSKTATWIGVASGSAIFVYISTALNQIPNVPENANLRKCYTRTFESVTKIQLQTSYLKTWQDLEQNIENINNSSQEKIVHELAKIIKEINQNTTYLKLNYKQMLINRFKNFEFTKEKITAIQKGEIKKLTKEELSQLYCLVVMNDIYQFLNAQSLIRLGLYEQTKPVEEIDQSNRYLEILANNKHKRTDDFKSLITLVESSIQKFIKLENKESENKNNVILQPSVVFVNGIDDKVDYGWQAHLQAKSLPRKLFGDTDLRECLTMELMIQKSLNAFLEELKARGYDVETIIRQAQAIVIEQIAEESKKPEVRNILPLQQSAGRISANENAEQKKSRCVIKANDLKKNKNQTQELLR